MPEGGCLDTADKRTMMDPFSFYVVRQKVLDALVNPFVACVTVVGGRGSGKTEMVIQACKYVRERRRFDAIFFATWDKPAVGWRTREDLCSLVRANIVPGLFLGGHSFYPVSCASLPLCVCCFFAFGLFWCSDCRGGHGREKICVNLS